MADRDANLKYEGQLDHYGGFTFDHGAREANVVLLGAERNPPTVENYSPTPDGSVAFNAAVSFDVICETYPIDQVFILAYFSSGKTEVIFDRTDFTVKYTADSTLDDSDEHAWSFSIERTGGWYEDFAIAVVARNTDSVSSESITAEWTVTGSTVPVVNGFTPSLVTVLDSEDQVQFDFTSPVGLSFLVEEISVQFADTTITEVVYSAGAFTAKYDTAPNAKSNITDGHRFIILREGGWPGDISFQFILIDSDGTQSAVTSGAWALSSVPVTVVNNFDPVEDATVETHDSISFDITNGFAINTINLWVEFGGTSETIYADGEFKGQYAASSSTTPITGGFTFAIEREDGWLDDPEIFWEVTDALNNVASGSATWDLDDAFTDSPIVTNFSPAPGQPFTANDALEFDIVDNLGITSLIIMATFGDDEQVCDVIFAGGTFRDKYRELSTVEEIENGYHFYVKPDHQWIAPPKLEWAINDGNLGIVVE